MTKILSAILVAMFCFAHSAAEAQTTTTPYSVDCVQQLTNGPCSTWIRNVPSFTAGNYLTVGGFYQQGDGGAGLFLAGLNDSCATVSVTGTISQSQNPNQVSVSSTTGISTGMSVISSGGAILPYDIITSVDTVHLTITLETPWTQTGSNIPLTIGPDNGGSVIADAETTPGPRCFYRASSQYTPKEWGAHEDGGTASPHDDTVALQSWMNTGQSFIQNPDNPYATGQSHIALAGTSSQQAISIVSFPLICQANTTIQGPTNLDGTTGTPLFTIEATNSGTFPTSSAVIDAYEYCRLSGIGIDGANVADGVDVYGQRVSIDGYSAIMHGSPYNVKCLAGNGALKIKDSLIAGAVQDGIRIAGGCNNVRIINDVISDAGSGGLNESNPARGIYFAGGEGIIADTVIEESQNEGVYLAGTANMSINGMFIQGNGRGTAGGAGIRVDNSNNVSICNNHFQNNGGFGSNSAQVYLFGTIDSLNFCGNVYEPKTVASEAVGPLYVYDADPNTTLTNTHFYDAPAPQAGGAVYSPNAALLLPQLQVPQVPLGQISGLTLSNTSGAQTVSIAPGEASDSTNSVSLQNATACSVNLGQTNNGPGGLDTGSVAAKTTYFYFLIGSASGGNPNCIASTSTAPNLTSTNYQASPTGQTQIGIPYLYNLSSVGGIAAGQTVTGPSIPSGTKVTCVCTATTEAEANLSTVDGVTTVQLSGGATTISIGTGMAVSDNFQFSSCGGTAQNRFAGGGYTVEAVPSPTGTTFTVNPPLPNSYTNDCVVVSSGNTIELSQNASATEACGAPNPNCVVYNGLYRLVGALYTDPAENVVPFTQDGNRFYLTHSVTDIETGMVNICASTVGTSPISCPLSVPCGRTAATCGSGGLKVIAFGRVVGGGTPGDILLSSLDQVAQTPSNFPTAPGFTTNSASTATSYPFELNTDGAGNVRVQGSTSSNTVYEVTDGWTLDRSTVGVAPLALAQAARRTAPIASRTKTRRQHSH